MYFHLLSTFVLDFADVKVLVGRDFLRLPTLLLQRRSR